MIGLWARSVRLVAFTIEPGLYLRQQALDDLPDTPENREFKARGGPVKAWLKASPAPRP